MPNMTNAQLNVKFGAHGAGLDNEVAGNYGVLTNVGGQANAKRSRIIAFAAEHPDRCTCNGGANQFLTGVGEPAYAYIAQHVAGAVPAVLGICTQNTANAATLAFIAGHANANAAVFAHVLANAALNGATRTALAQNNNADAPTLAAVVAAGAGDDDDVVQRPNVAQPELDIIAQRTANAATLAFIAGHANANAGTIGRVVNNAITNGPTLQAIVAHGAGNDAAVVLHANTLAADLATIAVRTVDPNILHRIAIHPHANDLVYDAIWANHAHRDAAIAMLTGDQLAIIANRTANADILHGIARHPHRNQASNARVLANGNTRAEFLAPPPVANVRVPAVAPMTPAFQQVVNTRGGTVDSLVTSVVAGRALTPSERQSMTSEQTTSVAKNLAARLGFKF